MELKQFAEILNTVFVPNEFGNPDDLSTPGMLIAENLDGIVDVGTKLADLRSADFMDYMKQIAVGVVATYFDGRTYSAPSYGLEMSGQEYGGAIQRVKARRMKMQNSAILNPVSVYDDADAPSYHDGHYYGAPIDAKLYTQDVAGKLVSSVSEEKLRKMVTTRQGWIDLLALLEANKENTLTDDLNQLSKTILRKLIVNADAGKRRINLIPYFNTKFGLTDSDPGYVTLENWEGNETFKLFCQKLIIRLKKAMREYNKRFNNGDIETFTPEEDIRVLLLSDFGLAVDFAQSSVYHKELTDIGEYETIEFWQNPGLDLLDEISETSNFDKILETDGKTEPTLTQVSYCVGIIRDKYAAGIVQKLDYTSVEPVGAEGFTNFHHHIARQYWIDDRNASVILCLDAEPEST